MIDSFRHVIGLWPSRSEMAIEVGESLPAVNQWWNRDSIPAAQFNAVVNAAEKRRFPVTHKLLSDLAEIRQANRKVREEHRATGT